MKNRSPISLLGVAVVVYCAAHCGDLATAWTTSPADRFAWVALILWLAFFGIAIIRERRLSGGNQVVGECYWLYAVAVLLVLAGNVGRINALEHVGTVLAIAGNRAFHWRRSLWIVAGACWTPAFGWLMLKLAPDFVLLMRIVLAVTGGVSLAWESVSPRVGVNRRIVQRGAVIACAAGALVLGALYRFVPLQGAEERLLSMATEGPGFYSWAAPLRPEERQLLGGGLASRRVYQVGGCELKVSVVDGTLNRHAVHDPVYCLTGAGYRVESDRRIDIEGGWARQLRLRKGGDRSTIVYWFSDGDQRHASIAQYWYSTTLRRMAFGATGEEPVLVIVQCAATDESEAAVSRCPPLFSV